MRRFTLLFALLIAIVLTFVFTASGFGQPSASTAGKKPFTFEDMMALKRVSGPAISPNGKWVMFSAMEVDLNANRKTTHLWLVPTAGGEARKLPATAAGETGGRWSPDGKSYLYLSAAEDGSQIWVNNFDPATGSPGGAPKKITSISTEADGAIWSPDGKNIVFTSEVYPGCMDDLCNKSSDETSTKSVVKARIFT